MRTVLLGASKGCGYFAALQLLETSPQDSITMLLRKPEVIENDPKFEGYIKEGRCKIVKGDATDEEDVRKCFEDKVDFVVSTIGMSSLLASFGAGVADMNDRWGGRDDLLRCPTRRSRHMYSRWSDSRQSPGYLAWY